MVISYNKVAGPDTTLYSLVHTAHDVDYLALPVQ